MLGFAAFVVGAVPSFGDVSAENGVAVHLNGLGVLVFTLVVLGYHFVFEVTTGKSVGKLALGLRVLGADGEPAPPGAVAVRTVLRLVDGFPIFYLVGFIAMVAGSPRGRRVGDMAAKTVVVRG